jgi:hypothetical protein
LPAHFWSIAASAAAHADSTTWKFEFLGLNGHRYDSLGRYDIPNATLAGFIEGEDLNHDNLIDKSELRSLTIGSDSFSGNFATCGTWSNVDHHCRLDRFVFAPGASPSLDISGYWRDVDDQFLASRMMEIATGDRYRYDESYGAGTHFGAYYSWNDHATLRITPVSPVPEPAGGLMLMAGLLGAAAMRRLRPK